MVLSDGPVPHIRQIEGSGVTFFEVWNTNETPAPLGAREDEPTDRHIVVPPAANGTIVRFCRFDPPDPGNAVTPGLMHRTETVDYGVVVSGEITLVLDDGSETPLGPGDVVVQRGTDHAWTNRSGAPALVAFVLVDAAFDARLKASLPGGALDRVMARPEL
ncbi:MAG: cupin domain-containing protein [Acidimicrobiales bacterium]